MSSVAAVSASRPYTPPLQQCDLNLADRLVLFIACIGGRRRRRIGFGQQIEGIEEAPRHPLGAIGIGRCRPDADLGDETHVPPEELRIRAEAEAMNDDRQ